MTPALPYRIEVADLTIRCYEPTDAASLIEVLSASRDHLTPWLPWAADEPDLDTQVNLLRSFRAQLDSGGDGIYGIFSGTDLVGGIGIHERIGPGARELGYWVRADRVRRGIITRSSAALTRLGIEFLELTRMEIHCEPANVASAGIPRKLGYQLEATLRRRPLSAEHPELRDQQIWTMFADEYVESPMANIEMVAYDAIDRPVFP